MWPFRFDDSALPAAPALVAALPADIKTKKALLEELAQSLQFPDYFGGNWDAMEECIRDLSWLPEGTVILKHSDLPLCGDVVNVRIYLAILRDTLKKGRWCSILEDEPSRLRDLVVVFPPDTRERVEGLLASATQ